MSLSEFTPLDSDLRTFAVGQQAMRPSSTLPHCTNVEIVVEKVQVDAENMSSKIGPHMALQDAVEAPQNGTVRWSGISSR